MRILIIGFIAFAGWSVFSTYIYVCNIKGLCMQTQTSIAGVVEPVTSLASKQDAAEQLAIPTDLVVNFAFDRSDFNSGAKAIEYFDASNALLSSNQQAMISITGHTDWVGTNEYNQALGLRRAQTMHRFFVGKGIPASRISIESKGEDEPVADNKSDEGRAMNRRSVVTIKQ